MPSPNAPPLPRSALTSSLRSAIARPPLSVPPDARIGDLLRRFGEERAEVAVVADPATQVPLGIVALHDLLEPIAGHRLDLSVPAATVMTGGVPSLFADATVQQATVLMTRRGLDHLLLVEADGRLFNVIGQRELYGLQAAGSETVVAGLLAARSIDALSRAAGAVREFAARRLAEGVGPEALCHWISALNDLVTVQAIDIVEAQHDLPIVPWCWLAFGSEGRLEQTLVTDQDNGIIFEPDGPTDAATLRRAFLPFARDVNAALASCGFPLCDGEIMAGNPKWCLSLQEWKDRFAHWISTPEPEPLLNATIFFDFRALYGRDDLAVALRDALLDRVRGNTRFLRAMTVNAREVEPPLRLFGGFRVEGSADFPDTIDLKTQAVRFFVDGARILALAQGIAATSTVERLRLAGRARQTPERETAASVEAFYQTQRLRLANQLSPAYPQAANRVNPAHVHALDRQILKEALRHASLLQQRLGMDFGA